MLVVVPVAEDDGVLLVVLVRLVGGVDDEGRAETVDVLARRVRVCPVGAPLAGGVDGDDVVVVLAGRDTAVICGRLARRVMPK